MADVAAVLADQHLPPLEAGRIGGLGDGLRRRQLGDVVGERAQIVVAEALHRIIHYIVAAQLLAKHEQLDQGIGRRLRTEGGDLGSSRLPLLAMAGEARSDALLERGRRGGVGRGADQHHRDKRAAHDFPCWMIAHAGRWARRTYMPPEQTEVIAERLCPHRA